MHQCPFCSRACDRGIVVGPESDGESCTHCESPGSPLELAADKAKESRSITLQGIQRASGVGCAAAMRIKQELIDQDVIDP